MTDPLAATDPARSPAGAADGSPSPSVETRSASPASGGPTEPAGTTSQMMKDGCWDLHQSAESAELPKRLVKGEVPRDLYIRMLSQYYPFATELDRLIAAHRGQVSELDGLVEESQYQGPYLEADLRYFGVEPSSVEPLPAVRSAIEEVRRVAEESPLLLLAYHYVREGANNGNRFVAMKLRPALGLPEDGSGLRHLDPYGSDQRALWDRFKQRLDDLPLTAEQQRRLVSAGRRMFVLITEINAAVIASEGSERADG